MLIINLAVTGKRVMYYHRDKLQSTVCKHEEMWNFKKIRKNRS